MSQTVDELLKTNPMKFLVWLKTARNEGAPQLWSDDYRVNSNTGKVKEYPFKIVEMIELKGDEQYMSISKLVKKYPCPEIKNEC